jgi:hypothetical protein
MGGGLFCGNFSFNRGSWTPCLQVWCAKCYKPLDENEFPIALPMNEDGLVNEEEVDSGRYRHARNGDNLMTPFQCDTCHFRNMMNRNPEPSLSQDHRVLKCIRRANLDSLWSVEPRTVSRNLTECRRGSNIAAALGFKSKLFRPMGPFPLDDTFGMCAAVVILQVSLNPGKHDKNVQFGTIRKFRSAFSNAYHATAQAQDAMVMAKDTRKLGVTKCPTYGAWFEKFMRGCHKRMGEIVKPDRALSAVILMEIFKILESEWDLHPDQKFRLASEGAFYAIAFSCALRGEEVPLADLTGMLKHWDKGLAHDPPHVTVALLGRFKGEVGENYHLLPIVPITRSGINNKLWIGINNKLWIGRLLALYKSYGVFSGPTFRNSRGLKIKAGDMEPVFFDRLEQVQASRPDLIPTSDDVVEDYGIYRSFRRGSTSEATNQGLPPEVIDANNRWRKFHRAGASRPTLQMRDHYADVRLTLKQTLRYSSSL